MKISIITTFMILIKNIVDIKVIKLINVIKLMLRFLNLDLFLIINSLI